MDELHVTNLTATVARLEALFEAIDQRLSNIESRMVSAEVLDQVVTRLLDKIAADTIKPGCITRMTAIERKILDNIEPRLRAAEIAITSLVVKMTIFSAAVAFLASWAKDLFIK